MLNNFCVMPSGVGKTTAARFMPYVLWDIDDDSMVITPTIKAKFKEMRTAAVTSGNWAPFTDFYDNYAATWCSQLPDNAIAMVHDLRIPRMIGVLNAERHLATGRLDPPRVKVTVYMPPIEETIDGVRKRALSKGKDPERAERIVRSNYASLSKALSHENGSGGFWETRLSVIVHERRMSPSDLRRFDNELTDPARAPAQYASRLGDHFTKLSTRSVYEREIRTNDPTIDEIRRQYWRTLAVHHPTPFDENGEFSRCVRCLKPTRHDDYVVRDTSIGRTLLWGSLVAKLNLNSCISCLDESARRAFDGVFRGQPVTEVPLPKAYSALLSVAIVRLFGTHGYKILQHTEEQGS